MATKVIAWGTGTGNITLTYGGQGNGVISIQSDANNLQVARSKQIVVKTTDNSIRRTITVRQNAKPDTVEYVDLGLPSGKLWAKYNVGANSETDSGYYFSWGNVDEHTVGDGYLFNTANYNSSPGKGLTTNIPTNATYDAARKFLGGSWRIPTSNEFEELVDHCTFEWTNISNKKCAKFTRNGNSLIIPVNGYIKDDTLTSSAQCHYITTIKRNDTEFYKIFITANTQEVRDATRRLGFGIRAIKSVT